MMFRPTPSADSPNTTPSSSPPPSPHKPLHMYAVANMFIRIRSARESSKVKSHHIHSASGDPQSHPGLAEAACRKKEPLDHMDVFICSGGVNVATLLKATRRSLLLTAEALGGNALVDEKWTCTVCGPKHRRSGEFRVQIYYTAHATRSTLPDPRTPVALDKAKQGSVPGLMTIRKRND